MAKDINQVITDSEEIRDETLTGANTATKVGGNLVDLGENIKDIITLTSASALISNPSGITGISLTTSYQKLKVTDSIIPITDTNNVFTVTYDVDGADEIIINKDGIYRFLAPFFIKGPTNREFFFKLYKNDLPINSGDGIGTNLSGNAQPINLSFTGLIPLVAGDKINFYGKGDSATTIDLTAGNWEFQETNLTV